MGVLIGLPLDFPTFNVISLSGMRENKMVLEHANGLQLREDWLTQLMGRMRSEVFTNDPVPLNIRVSCSFPGSRGLPGKKQVIGQCWDAACSADGHFEVFISPVNADPMLVAAVLAHELIHATVGIDAKHGKLFKRVATDIGLEGKMTATCAGPDFIRAVEPILEHLGPYPHATLDPTAKSTKPKKQGTRLLKAECPMCQYTVRITRKWLDDVGPPHCPNHGPMEVDEPEGSPEDPTKE